MKYMQVIIDGSIEEEKHEIHFGTSRFGFKCDDFDSICRSLDKSYEEVDKIEQRIKEFARERAEFGFTGEIKLNRIAIRVTREDESVIGEVVIDNKNELTLLPQLYELFIQE